MILLISRYTFSYTCFHLFPSLFSPSIHDCTDNAKPNAFSFFHINASLFSEPRGKSIPFVVGFRPFSFIVLLHEFHVSDCARVCLDDLDIGCVDGSGALCYDKEEPSTISQRNVTATMQFALQGLRVQDDRWHTNELKYSFSLPAREF